MSDLLNQTESGGVMRLAFDRPEKLNAFNDEMTQALLAALEAAATSQARVIVLTGNGRGFSAGQDLAEFAPARAPGGGTRSVAAHLRAGYNRIVLRIRELDRPVIAQMNGVAAGVGLALALACDFRIAADDATLTLGFSKIGLIPDGGASLFLPLLAGFGRGLELAMTSERISAAEAYRLGLVNRVVAAADLGRETDAFAARLVAMPRSALALTKRAFNAAIVPQLAAWLDAEADLQELASHSEEHRDGVRAFLEKRAG